MLECRREVDALPLVVGADLKRGFVQHFIRQFLRLHHSNKLLKEVPRCGSVKADEDAIAFGTLHGVEDIQKGQLFVV